MFRMSNSDNESNHRTEPNPNDNETPSRTLDSRFECPICLSCMREPVLTACGHKFCSKCIDEWLEKKGGSCPVDSTPLEEGDLFLDRYTSREISQYKTKCPYQQFGCSVELCPIDMDEHVNECEFRKNAFIGKKIFCEFKHVGCDEECEDEESLRKHLETTRDRHLLMIGKTVSEIRISQSEVNKKARDPELWDAPPKNSQSQPERTVAELEKLIKELYEKVVILEQKNREQSIIISNQQSSYQQELSKYSSGVYIWRIDHFRQKITDMMAQGTMLYSDEFYTHKNGYKVCGRINISKKDLEFLSIVLHLVPSENDDALDWPFIGIISFVLVHPDDSERSIREKTYTVPGLEAFKRPGAERNRRSFGYTEFISLDELHNFIKNDQVIFRLEVKASDRFENSHLNEQGNE